MLRSPSCWVLGCVQYKLLTVQFSQGVGLARACAYQIHGNTCSLHGRRVEIMSLDV